ncbi:HNH endonuclease [Lactobacillus sp. ESL0233]|uniref:HNH endonuclease n=1 Tax=Lactobacillus sp. ESL0233 TaxID=2069354 RepID=UPI000EFB5158|nr:HNH endonuclease [Lactobacillus sp. ESL0233]RMC41745.1 HNH endonuclease [Lactobacillus sp. ESL0233]
MDTNTNIDMNINDINLSKYDSFIYIWNESSNNKYKGKYKFISINDPQEINNTPLKDTSKRFDGRKEAEIEALKAALKEINSQNKKYIFVFSQSIKDLKNGDLQSNPKCLINKFSSSAFVSINSYCKRFGYKIKNNARKNDNKNNNNFKKKFCAYCHNQLTNSGQIDHVIPIWAGGNGEIDNLLVTCEKCNNNKGSRILSCSLAEFPSKSLYEAQRNYRFYLFKNKYLVRRQKNWRYKEYFTIFIKDKGNYINRDKEVGCQFIICCKENDLILIDRANQIKIEKALIKKQYKQIDSIIDSNKSSK